MNRTLLRALLIGLTGLAAVAHGLPEDRDQPIRISADRAEMDDATGTAVYRGDVRMDQGTMQVSAATLTIETEDEAVVRITAEGTQGGEPAHYEQKPAVDQELVRARAGTIVYLTADEHIELRGDAHLRQSEDRFEGDLIRYDMRARKVTASSDRDSGRVTFTIAPERLSRGNPPDEASGSGTSGSGTSGTGTSGTDPAGTD
jgi:lipopolysaccharide export system protein LptA